MEKVNRRTIIGPCFAFCAITSGLCGYFFYVEGSLLVPGRWISFVAMLAISGICLILIFSIYSDKTPFRTKSTARGVLFRRITVSEISLTILKRNRNINLPREFWWHNLASLDCDLVIYHICLIRSSHRCTTSCPCEQNSTYNSRTCQCWQNTIFEFFFVILS